MQLLVFAWMSIYTGICRKKLGGDCCDCPSMCGSIRAAVWQCDAEGVTEKAQNRQKMQMMMNNMIICTRLSDFDAFIFLGSC
ncbi:hypothetical protein KSF73_09020 [Burkholderiaceae bacterium DAT-1]|nr:hypothetical protein [Burkholderiaceae bacterium DAT-1]